MEKEDFTHLPNHVAIIMDGNGRWPKKIGKKRAFGHENGTKSVRECIDQSIKLGIKNLTLFVFSTENWNRPIIEVNALMDLLVYSLDKERVSLIDNGIKLNVIGDLETLKNKPKSKLKDILYVQDFDDKSFRKLAGKDFKSWPDPLEETWRLSRLGSLSRKKIDPISLDAQEPIMSKLNVVGSNTIKFINYFEDIFENCPFHSLEHTKIIFRN